MKRSKSLQAEVVVMALACFMSLLFISSISAQPLSVSVSGAQYMTYVEAVGYPTNLYPETSRTTLSSSPISDEMDFPNEYSGPPFYGTNHAIASAGLFGVSDQTGWGFANAEAVSQLWFSPLTNQTQTLNIQIYAEGYRGEPQDWTAGQVSLFDLTANYELWNYSWNAGGSVAVPVQVPSGDNIPWDSQDSPNADFSLDTHFLASDQYELTMIVCSDAGDDRQIAQIQLTGLQVVPEPSTTSILGVSVVVLTICGSYLRSRACHPAC